MGFDRKENKSTFEPCLVWLSGLSAGLQMEGSLVRFLVRAHAGAAGQVLSRGTGEATTH